MADWNLQPGAATPQNGQSGLEPYRAGLQALSR